MILIKYHYNECLSYSIYILHYEYHDLSNPKITMKSPYNHHTITVTCHKIKSLTHHNEITIKSPLT